MLQPWGLSARPIGEIRQQRGQDHQQQLDWSRDPNHLFVLFSVVPNTDEEERKAVHTSRIHALPVSWRVHSPFPSTLPSPPVILYDELLSCLLDKGF